MEITGKTFFCHGCKKDVVLGKQSSAGICFRCVRGRTYWGKYGIKIGDFERMLEEQGGRCGVCGKEFPVEIYDGEGHRGDRPVLDHDPITGNARGVLCGRCVTVMGTVGVDAERWFPRADAYLRKYGTLPYLEEIGETSI